MNILEYAIARKLLGGSGGSAGGDSGGGSVSVSQKAVNFRDYDGTVLHSYTKDEALALTALPELPTQPGLICQEWNWSLEDMQSCVAYCGICEVGATYITDDGKTRLYISIGEYDNYAVELRFSQTVANGITIDWGDGSEPQTLPYTGNRNPTHTYANSGEYVITLNPVDECTIGLGDNSTFNCVIGPANSSNVYNTNRLVKAEVGNNVLSISTFAFNRCISLKSITIPNSVTSIGESAFGYCACLESVTIPKNVQSLGRSAFEQAYRLHHVIFSNNAVSIGAQIVSNTRLYTYIVVTNGEIPNYAYNGNSFVETIVICDGATSIGEQSFASASYVKKVILPDSLTSIGNSAFSGATCLRYIKIPASVTSIGSSAFDGCRAMKVYDFTNHTSVPTISSTYTFNNIPSSCEIRVPAALAEEWKAATNWSTYASKIVGV